MVVYGTFLTESSRILKNILKIFSLQISGTWFNEDKLFMQ